MACKKTKRENTENFVQPTLFQRVKNFIFRTKPFCFLQACYQKTLLFICPPCQCITYGEYKSNLNGGSRKSIIQRGLVQVVQ